MGRGATESEKGNPLAIEFGHITEAGAAQSSTMQIMLPFQKVIESRPFLLPDQANGDSSERVGFGPTSGLCHAPPLPEAVEKI
jgi:hypothetical protein